MGPDNRNCVIVVKADIGKNPISQRECVNNQKTIPVFNELERLMEQRGWVKSGVAIIEDLSVGNRIWQDPSNGHYYFGLRAFRRSYPPSDENYW